MTVCFYRTAARIILINLLQDVSKKYKALKIVTFYAVFKDKDGELQKINGVTQSFQDDDNV
ncbi:MAG: hypothetical protein OSJ43_11145 [Oscillospiraceae bacterium]|nr:hypothetical protein [Oscillospiraceae bacterium]